MILYSDRDDHYSQRVRIVLAEKDISAEINEAKQDETPDEILSISPYHRLPILVDRDLAIHDPSVMMEYLDERFPHPPLLPVYPVARAQSRLFVYRIQRDWCGLVDTIVAGRSKDTVIDRARKELREGLITIAPIFSEKEFFMSDEFTLVDCCFVPILWRLPVLGIQLPPKTAKPLTDYMNRMFRRESFQASLSEAEMDMRD